MVEKMLWIAFKERPLFNWAVPLLILLLSVGGCTGTPDPGLHVDKGSYTERAERQSKDGFTVKASALSITESEEVFGIPLNNVGIQPVWIEIENTTEQSQWVFPIGIDENYFPPYEVARRASGLSRLSDKEIYEQLAANHIDLFIPANTKSTGFVYAHSDEGMKAFDVDLYGKSEVHKFHFVVPVPGLPTDYFDVDADSVYPPHDLPNLSEDELRAWLEKVLCCTVNIEGELGDPLNIVLVGTIDQVRSALISRDWDVTAPVTSASLWRMTTAFIFGSRYRYAPISSLYAFNREHDLAFQKSRALIDERNHMRLWLAPVLSEGHPVWIGQISRDVGVKLSGRLWPPTTHVVDPDMDDARFFLQQELLEAQALKKLGFVKGHQPTNIYLPHTNAEGDPYFTDGMRAVFYLSVRPVPVTDVELLEWELPRQMQPFRKEFFPENAEQ